MRRERGMLLELFPDLRFGEDITSVQSRQAVAPMSTGPAENLPVEKTTAQPTAMIGLVDATGEKAAPMHIREEATSPARAESSPALAVAPTVETSSVQLSSLTGSHLGPFSVDFKHDAAAGDLEPRSKEEMPAMALHEESPAPTLKDLDHDSHEDAQVSDSGQVVLAPTDPGRCRR